MVSVVVITYNSSKTLLDTLESIFNQIYKDIELIITDDGSKDNTVAIAKKWLQDNYKRFIDSKVIESVNTGVAANCNRGIFASRGKYIQIIAGDDILLPNAISIKYAYAEQHNSTIVFSKTEPFGNNPQNVDKMKKFCENGYAIILQGREAQRRAILKDNYIAGPSGGFYSAQFVKGIGGYDEQYPMMEDYPFIYHYIYKGYEIDMVDQVLSYYRISDGSLCMKKGSPMNVSHAKFFFKERFIEMLKEKRYGLALEQTLKFTAKLVLYKLYNLK